MSSEIQDKIKGIVDDKYMEGMGFLKKGDLDGMLNATKDLTIKQVIDHKDCGVDGCGVCGMKFNLNDDAYKRGLRGGIQLKTKYPQFKFAVEEK